MKYQFYFLYGTSYQFNLYYKYLEIYIFTDIISEISYFKAHYQGIDCHITHFKVIIFLNSISQITEFLKFILYNKTMGISINRTSFNWL